jgi:hypothetical protein
MKNIVLPILILIGTFSFAQAQEDDKDQIKTILTKPSKVRGFIGPITNTTTLDGDVAYMTGVNAGGIFNDHFIFGFYKVDLENTVYSSNSSYNGSSMDFDHKGLWLGYIFMPQSMIHFNVNVQAGKGNLEIYDTIFDTWIEDDFIFVLTPSLEAEFNVAKFLRVGIGANYRLMFDVDRFDNYSDKDFSELGAFVSFKFGWFN